MQPQGSDPASRPLLRRSDHSLSERAASRAYVLPKAFGESAKARRRRSRYMRHSLGSNRLMVIAIPIEVSVFGLTPQLSCERVK